MLDSSVDTVSPHEPRATRRRRSNARSSLPGPVAGFAAAALGGALILLILAGLLVGTASAALGIAVAGYLGAAALATALMRRDYPHARLGLCNLVTLMRLIIACALLAPLIAPGSAKAIIAAASVALVLDGVDGWLARRQGYESAFGARFDMEVDAALGMILALNAWVAGTVGPAVLLLGLPRYAFAAAAWRWQWIGGALPERFGRKVVCVVQIVALIVLQLPLMTASLANAILFATLLALGWSFGRDLRWLWRNRSYNPSLNQALNQSRSRS